MFETLQALMLQTHYQPNHLKWQPRPLAVWGLIKANEVEMRRWSWRHRCRSQGRGHRGPSILNKGIKSKQRGGQRRAYKKGEGQRCECLSERIKDLKTFPRRFNSQGWLLQTWQTLDSLPHLHQTPHATAHSPQTAGTLHRRNKSGWSWCEYNQNMEIRQWMFDVWWGYLFIFKAVLPKRKGKKKKWFCCA